MRDENLKTERLYYENPYLRTFTAQIVRQSADKTGRYYVVLNRTCFYPTGGGQPCDHGTLEDVCVIAVEKTDGEIRHYVEKPLDEQLPEIHGIIEWDRRFDHMQQHAGQHILTAAFVKACSFKTIAFHMGPETCTIDLDTSELTAESAKAAEELANDIALENQPILTKWLEQKDLENYPLRKMPTVTEDIRLVIIEGVDYNPCGGTHPGRAGEIGLIKIIGWKSDRGHVRVSFVCGKRSLSLFGKEHHQLYHLARFFNTNPDDILSHAEKLAAEVKQWEQKVKHLKEHVAELEAQHFASLIGRGNDQSMLAYRFENRSMNDIRRLAHMLTEHNPECTVLFVTENEGQIQIVCARGADVPGDMRRLLADSLSLIHGKGGGNPAMAQGAGNALISSEQVLNHMREFAAHFKD